LPCFSGSSQSQAFPVRRYPESFDYGINVPHNVNATQNGIGTGIVNATFMIIPTIALSPQPANYE
jgi:hypothetical protein